MQHLGIRLTIAVLFLSGTLEFHPRQWETPSAVAAPTEECQVLGQIDLAEGGELFVSRGGSQQPLTVGDRLCAGDRVQLAANTRAMAICEADGEVRSLPAGMRSRVTTFCPVVKLCDETIENPGCGRDSGPQLASGVPHILSPRDTALLENQPKFRWQAVPGATQYRVTLEREEIVWGPIEVSETEVVYSGVPLEVGPSYKVRVEADTGSTDTARFSLLNEAQRAQVMAAIEIQPTASPAAIPPVVYVYLEHRLFSKAIETLESLVDNGSPSATVHFQLGELYQQIGLLFKAELAYGEAIELSQTEANCKGEAIARAKLGQVYKSLKNQEEAFQQLNQAKALYEQCEDLQRAGELEELLGEL